MLGPYAALMGRLVRTGSPFIDNAMRIHNYGPAFAKFAFRYWRNPRVLLEASVDDVRVVVDLGAWNGDWAAQVQQRYDCTVYSFEPAPGARALAEKRLEHVADVQLLPYGLAHEDKQVDMLMCGPGATAYPEAMARLGEDVAFAQTRQVRMRDVKGVFDELALGRVDLLKVNIEGGEYDLLDRLIETEYVARCRSLLIQFHEWFPNAYARRRKIHHGLKRTHDLDFSDYFVWERWTRRGEH